MKVQCTDIKDFLDNIIADGPSNVDRKVIYVNIEKRQVGDIEVKKQISLQCYAAINVVIDNSYYILYMESDCGIDYTDASACFDGTRKATLIKDRVEKFCEENGLTIRPGKLDFS